MILHTVFVTHNRRLLTMQAIESYFATVTVPFTMAVVDNASTDGTQERLTGKHWFPIQLWDRIEVVLLDKNFYPGYATNRGWEFAPKDATHFQRADNDMLFLPGWCDEVERMFTRKKRLGQLGLRTALEERQCATNVGGNCVINRELWDKGLRWDERPWRQFPAGLSEDTFFSPAVREMGYVWGRVEKPCLEMLSPDLSEVERWQHDPYYVKSFADRKIRRPSGRRR